MVLQNDKGKYVGMIFCGLIAIPALLISIHSAKLIEKGRYAKMKDNKCRFIEEYANFQIRQFKEDATLYDYDAERKAFCEKAIERIEKAVKMARSGMITVNDCMDTICHPVKW